MAGPPAVAGGIWQVRLIGEIHGQKTVNVLHFNNPGPVDDVELRLIVALMNCFLTHLVPVLSSDYTLKEIRYQGMTTNPPTQEFIKPVVGGTGTGSGTALPSFCTAVVSIQGTIGGRSGKGRFSLSGIPEDQTVDSTIDTSGPLWAGLVAFVACVAGAFIHPGAPPANSFQWIVYSRKMGGAEVPFSLVGATKVLSATPKAQIGTINSRKVGRGA